MSNTNLYLLTITAFVLTLCALGWVTYHDRDGGNE